MAGESRIAQAIRAIVLGVIKDGKSDPLTTQQIRDAIAGKRGIGYMFPDGLNAGGVSGTAGLTLLGSSFGNLSQFATNEEIEKIKNAAENAPKSIGDVLNIHIGGKAMAITGVEDCETGKDIEIVNTPEFKNPDGWLGPNDPGATLPEYQKWTFGLQWAGTGPGIGGPFLTPLEAATASRDLAGDAAYSEVEGSNHITAGGANIWQIFFRNPGLPPGSFPVTYQGSAGACTPDAADAACPLTYKYIWPVDNKMQLAKGADGKYKFSPNEPTGDVIPAYTDNQHSTLDVCFSDGSGRKASIEPTRDGGWIVYETLDGEGVGIATVYDTTNTAIAKINTEDKGEVTVSGF